MLKMQNMNHVAHYVFKAIVKVSENKKQEIYIHYVLQYIYIHYHHVETMFIC